MASAADKSQPTPRQLAEAAPPSRMARSTLRSGPRCRRASLPQRKTRLLYERERRVVEILHAARAVDRAPAGLRGTDRGPSPESPRPRPAPPRVRWRRRGSAGRTGPGARVDPPCRDTGGTIGEPGRSAGAARHCRPRAGSRSTHPDSRARGKDRRRLLPNWGRTLGWRAIGRRSDRIGGRLALTVYYEWEGKRVAYTIVDAPALKQPATHARRLGGVELRTLTVGGRLVVTWRRRDHTCVLSGAGIPADVLQKLAAWKAPAT